MNTGASPKQFVGETVLCVLLLRLFQKTFVVSILFFLSTQGVGGLVWFIEPKHCSDDGVVAALGGSFRPLVTRVNSALQVAAAAAAVGDGCGGLMVEPQVLV